MSKTVQKKEKLSSNAEGAISDLSKLQARYDSYVSSIEIGRQSGTFTDSEIIARHHDSCLSVIDGLGINEFRNHLTEQQKESLVTSINQTSAAVTETLSTKQEKDKLALNTAKIEASLKGFELPLSIGGPSNELNFHSLNKDNYLKIIDCTKKSLIELAGTQTPTEQYTDKIKALILAKASTIFPPEQMESVGKIVEQGRKLKDSEKSIKKQKFKQHDLPILQKTATDTSKQFQDILLQNQKKAIALKIVQESLKDLEAASNLRITDARTGKVINNLVPALAQLKPEYLDKNREGIIQNLQQELLSKRTLGGRIRGEFRISEKDRKEIADNILKQHLEKSEEFVVAKKAAVTEKLLESAKPITPKAKKLNKPPLLSVSQAMDREKAAASISPLGEQAPSKSTTEDLSQSIEKMASPKKKVAIEQLPKTPADPVVAKAEKDVAIKLLITEAIEKFEQTHKKHITPSMEARIVNALKAELTKLPTKTITEKTPEMASDISNNLNKKKTFFTRFFKNYNISSKNLKKLTQETSVKIEKIKPKPELKPEQSVTPKLKKMAKNIQKNITSGAETPWSKTATPIKQKNQKGASR